MFFLIYCASKSIIFVAGIAAKLLRNRSLNFSSGQFCVIRLIAETRRTVSHFFIQAGLTEFFWVRSGSPLVAALFAASLYGVLARMYELKGGAQRALTDLKYSYVNKANSIMELAMTKDKEKAVSLVDKRYERFGRRSLINIGYGGHLKSFIANEVCQVGLYDKYFFR